MSLPWLELLNNLMRRYLGKDAETSILKPQGANLVATINRFLQKLEIFIFICQIYFQIFLCQDHESVRYNH
jgi:hypothetical protein